MLKVYSAVTKPASKGRSDEDPLESVAKLVSAAAKLGAKLESDVFQGTISDALRPYTSSFSDLPGRLAEFSKELGGKLDLIGKPGHKEGNLNGFFLIVESPAEFMRFS